MLISKSTVIQDSLTIVESSVLADWVSTSIWLLVVVVVVTPGADIVVAAAFEGLVYVVGLVDVLRSVDGLA
jgi:hypothetical protein